MSILRPVNLIRVIAVALLLGTAAPDALAQRGRPAYRPSPSPRYEAPSGVSRSASGYHGYHGGSSTTSGSGSGSSDDSGTWIAWAVVGGFVLLAFVAKAISDS